MEFEIENNTATSVIVAKPKRQPKALPGLWIVWRMKGAATWQKGYIKDSYAKGKIIRITDSQYSSEHTGSMVAVDDIDWMRQ